MAREESEVIRLIGHPTRRLLMVTVVTSVVATAIQVVPVLGDIGPERRLATSPPVSALGAHTGGDVAPDDGGDGSVRHTNPQWNGPMPNASVTTTVGRIGADLVAESSSPATRIGTQLLVDRFGPITSVDAGPNCATSLSAADLAAFFSGPIGPFQGGDYQRTVRLPDDRVLWTFQDAFIEGALVHNAAFVQSGRCFTLLDPSRASWLLADETIPLRRWHWILGGDVTTDRTRIALFVVEMRETGDRYLHRPRPVVLRRIDLDATSLEVIGMREQPRTGDDLYGWSVTSDDRYTYLYSHCFQQFGYDSLFGSAPCVEHVKVARLPRGRFDAAPEYWNGSTWSGSHTDAVPVIDGTFVYSGNNPAQVRFDGTSFWLVEKRDDWWGATIEFGVSSRPGGPFTHVGTLPQPTACDPAVCNTYFAGWVPWRDPSGALIWSISRNVWSGASSPDQFDRYRPTFGTFAGPDGSSWAQQDHPR
jgi:hypothetical protein